MKKFLLFLVCVISILVSGIICVSALAESSPPGNSAKAAVLIHGDTGTVLFEQNADDRMLVASTTKIMTAFVVLENCAPEEEIEIKSEYCGIEGSSMYLSAGTTRKTEELLYGLMLASGNDAAVALAHHVGGTIEGFAAMMNEKAEELGLENSHFTNPHGLDAEEHYSSARDLAVITSEAMKNDKFREIVSTRSVNLEGLTFVNHNKLLWNYEGTVGGKTGYTMAAGRSLVSCAERDGMLLICVTLSDPDDWNDHTALYDWGFDNYRYEQIVNTEEITKIPVISGEVERIGVAAERELTLLLKKDDIVDRCYELPRFTYAAVTDGERAGAVVVRVNDEVVARIELSYTRGVSIADGIRLTVWEKIRRAWLLSSKFGGIKYGYYGTI